MIPLLFTKIIASLFRLDESDKLVQAKLYNRQRHVNFIRLSTEKQFRYK